MIEGTADDVTEERSTAASDAAHKQGEVVATGSEETDDRAVPDAVGMARNLPRPGPVPRRRNQMLAIVLASLIAGLFIFVVGLVIALHYAETHHMLANL
ncbi:hypothetical protein MHY1_01192 [Methylovirgula sp. HY1]|nr:hypothetical protein MHY1_01192 [Methylovirgula sp. HY1]